MAKKGIKIKKYKNIYKKRRRTKFVFKVVAGLLFCAGFFFVGYFTLPLVSNIGELFVAEQSPPIKVEIPGEKQVESSGKIEVNVNRSSVVNIPVAELRNSSIETTIDELVASGVTTVEVELKAEDGSILYTSQNEFAASAGLISADAIVLTDVVETLHSNDIDVVVLINVFKDSGAPQQMKDAAVKYQDTSYNWLDLSPELGGKAWFNPYSTAARDYVLYLISEVVNMGVDGVVLGGLQFPQGESLGYATYPEMDGLSKEEALSGFVNQAELLTDAAGCELTVLIPLAAALGQMEYQYSANPFAIMMPAAEIDCSGENIPTRIIIGETNLDFSEDLVGSVKTSFDIIKEDMGLAGYSGKTLVVINQDQPELFELFESLNIDVIEK